MSNLHPFSVFVLLYGVAVLCVVAYEKFDDRKR